MDPFEKTLKETKQTLPAGALDMLLSDPAARYFGARIVRAKPDGDALFTFVYLWRRAGERRQRKIKIGRWPGMSVAIARRKAAVIDADRTAGVDPRAEALEAKRAEQSTLRKILGEDGKPGPYALSLERGSLTGGPLANRAEMLATLERVLAPLMHKDIAKVTAGELESTLDAIATRGAALEGFKQVRRLFRWARNRHCDGRNVLADSDWAKRTGGRAPANDNDDDEAGRQLGEAEIRRLWAATATDRAYDAVVRLALLTGMRRIEAAKLTRAMIGVRRGDKFVVTPLADADRIGLPWWLTKSRKPHDIPLTPMVRDLLAGRPEGDLFFASPRDGRVLGSWDDSAVALTKKAALDAKFKMHDMRKTCRSIMTEQNVDRDFGDDFGGFCIGHAHQGLRRIYDKAKRWPARIEAAERVCNYIRGLVAEPELAVAV